MIVLVRANNLEMYRYVRVFVRDEHMQYVVYYSSFKWEVAQRKLGPDTFAVV